MNNIKLIITNSIFILWLYLCGYLYPQYAWSVRTFLYIIMSIALIGRIYYLVKTEEIPESLKKKYTTVSYNIIDHIFDVAMLAIFIVLDYRALFIMYVVDAIFAVALKMELYRGRVKP